MKIVVAIDSFKGSASSSELNGAVAERLNQLNFVEKVEKVSISDGGEGAVEAISQRVRGDLCKLQTIDLLERPIEAEYLVFEKDQRQCAFIESASILGIDLINPSEETIQAATSRGLGKMIKEIATQEIEEIIVSLGGTGVSDGGLGLLQEFGMKFFDKGNNPLSTGNLLLKTAKIDLEDFHMLDRSLTIATDVESTYCGPLGAQRIFAAQKGASAVQIDQLDQQAILITQLIKEKSEISLNEIAGTGAAGGIGGALLMLNGQMESGFSIISSLVGLEQAIQQADLVITGEGRIDKQSFFGKVPFGVATVAKRYNRPVIALCGSKVIGDLTDDDLFAGIFSIQTAPISLVEALEKELTLKNTAALAYSLVNMGYRI